MSVQRGMVRGEWYRRDANVKGKEEDAEDGD